MSVRRWIPAITAGLMMTFSGSAAATAASTPAHAHADQVAGIPSQSDTDTFNICNYADNSCITSNGVSGDQVHTTTGTAHLFEWTGPAAAELKDTSTGLCLKDDPNVGNDVVELACSNSGTTEEEEQWDLVFSDGVDNFVNVYALDIGKSAGEYLHEDTLSSYVNCYKINESGDNWY
jgi:hypothetical protein